jgi:hypothetical protein
MAAKAKKRKLSGVAKMVKTFLKRKKELRIPTSEKSKQPKKSYVSKPRKAERPLSQKTDVRRNGPKPVFNLPKPQKDKKKNGRTNSHGIKGQVLPHVTPNHAVKPSKSPISGPRYFFNTDIPDSYNETYMRAIPRDPQWLFAYWEISESTRKQVRSKIGEDAASSAKRVLRLIDITDIEYDGSNATCYCDIEINEFANNWYVQVPKSGRNYVLELGLLTTDGRFYSAARSNAVSVPRMGVSQLMDEEWATVSTDELIRMSADAMRYGMGSSERRFAAAETLVGHAGLAGSLGSGSGSGGLGDFSSGARF